MVLSACRWAPAPPTCPNTHKLAGPRPPWPGGLQPHALGCCRASNAPGGCTLAPQRRTDRCERRAQRPQKQAHLGQHLGAPVGGHGEQRRGDGELEVPACLGGGGEARSLGHRRGNAVGQRPPAHAPHTDGRAVIIGRWGFSLRVTGCACSIPRHLEKRVGAEWQVAAGVRQGRQGSRERPAGRRSCAPDDAEVVAEHLAGQGDQGLALGGRRLGAQVLRWAQHSTARVQHARTRRVRAPATWSGIPSPRRREAATSRRARLSSGEPRAPACAWPRGFHGTRG